MKKLFLIIFASQMCFAQNINKIEYFIDADPGYGAGVDVPVTAAISVTADFNVALGVSVTDGFHTLSIRARDANSAWSMVGIRPFYKETLGSGTTSPNITQLEYFIDADPGYGLGTAVAVTAGSPITQNFTVALPSVSDGFHTLSIRAKDANNRWSIVGIRPFYKETLGSGTTIPNITQLEYIIDADPGYGLGTAVAVTAGSPVTLNFMASLSSLSVGTHKISIRAKDTNNKWSIVGVKDFVVSNTFTLVGSTPQTWCRATTFNLPFTAVGTFNAGNIFTAQLSNSSGSFTSPTILGTLTSTSSGTIVATIPNTVALGSGYLIRVVSSNPSASDNPSIPISIVSVCPPPCPTSMILASTADDYSNGILIKEVNASTGIIVATNKITNTANVTYRAGKSITLNAGFKADNGVVFKTEFGGCN